MPLNLAAWKELLKESKGYLDTKYKTSSLRRSKKGFISFSWERDDAKKQALQTWLSALRNDLKTAALDDVFLDINNMDGNLKETMLENLRQSDVVFFICNPRFIERLKEKDSDKRLGFEIKEVLELIELKRRKKAPFQVILLLQGGDKDLGPLLQSGIEDTAMPAEFQGVLKELQGSIKIDGALDFRQEQGYQKTLTGFRETVGLIPIIHNISAEEDTYQQLFVKLQT